MSLIYLPLVVDWNPLFESRILQLGVFRLSQEYFTYITVGSIMVGENPGSETHDHSQVAGGSSGYDRKPVRGKIRQFIFQSPQFLQSEKLSLGFVLVGALIFLP